QYRGQGVRGRHVTAARPRRDLRPQTVRRFTAQIPKAMDQAALAERARKARLNRADESGRAVGDDEEWIDQAAALEILEEGSAARCVLVRPRREMEQHLVPLLRDTPRAEHRLAGQPHVQALGDAVDEEIGDDELSEVAAREGFVLLPQALGDLAHGRATQDARARR